MRKWLALLAAALLMLAATALGEGMGMCIETCEGSFTVTDQDGNPIDVPEDSCLPDGSTITTDENSFLCLKLDSGGRVMLDAETSARFEKRGGDLTRAELEKGILYILNDKDVDLWVSTPDMSAYTQGATGIVATDREEGTKFLLLDGTAKMAPDAVGSGDADRGFESINWSIEIPGGSFVELDKGELHLANGEEAAQRLWANLNSGALAFAQSQSEAFNGVDLAQGNEEATGHIHKYRAAWYAFSHDRTECIGYAMCADCEEVFKETAKVEFLDYIAPTCTSAGLQLISVEFSAPEFSDLPRQINYPALGHAWGEASYEWSADHQTCMASVACTREGCGEVLSETVNAAGTVTRPASCAAAGETTYEATFADKLFATQTVSAEDIPAQRHALTEVGELPADCEDEGVGAFWICRDCAAMFADAEGQTAISQPKTIPALGHIWGEASYTWSADHSACAASTACLRPGCGKTLQEEGAVIGVITKSPTCTAPGEAAYTATFIEAAFTAQTVIETNVPKEDHGLSRTEEEPVTCEDDGIKEYWSCFTCGALFSDARGEKQISAPETIPALGHIWGEASYTWSQDYSSCAAFIACTRPDCHREVEEDGIVSFWVSKAPTCTAEGETTYTAAFTETVFAAQTVTETNVPKEDHGLSRTEEEPVTCEDDGIKEYWSCFTCGALFSDARGEKQISAPETIPALGHIWGEASYTWAQDYSSCAAFIACTRPDCHREVEEDGIVSFWVSKSPTCTAEGETTYTAAFTETVFTAQTVTETNVPREDHGLSRTEEEPVTCEDDGIKEYWSCFTCGALFGDARGEKQISAPEIIPALGHIWGEASYTWAQDYSSCAAFIACVRPDCHREVEEEGQVSRQVSKVPTCAAEGEAVCTATFTETVFAAQTATVNMTKADHSLKLVEESAATCEDAGTKMYWACAACGALFSDGEGKTAISAPEVIPPTHEWGWATFAWQGIESATASVTCARNPAHVLTVECEVTREVIEEATETKPGTLSCKATAKFLLNGAEKTYTQIISESIPVLTGREAQ